MSGIILQVAWVRVDTQTILSIHHNVITQNPRITLSHNDHRSWYLHIRNVQETDRGWYMCQVNTDPMRSRKGYLQVVGGSHNAHWFFQQVFVRTLLDPHSASIRGDTMRKERATTLLPFGCYCWRWCHQSSGWCIKATLPCAIYTHTSLCHITDTN